MAKKFIVFFFVFLMLGISTVTASTLRQGCSIISFTMSPSSPYLIGTWVSLSGQSNCGTVKFELTRHDGAFWTKAEIGTTNQTETWKTEETGIGYFTVCFVARGEGGWENAARSCFGVDVYDNNPPPVYEPPPQEPPVYEPPVYEPPPQEPPVYEPPPQENQSSPVIPNQNTDTQQVINCSIHEAPVYVGGEGVVTTGNQVRIRSGAGTSYRRIGTALSGVVFDVLDGPICAGGFYWWEINYQGINGWIAEGNAQEYWIATANTAVDCGIYCASVYNLPTLPRGTNHWITIDFYNSLYQQVQDKITYYENALKLKEWAISQGQDVVIEWIISRLANAHITLGIMTARAFLSESGADYRANLTLWKTRRDRMENFYNDSQYRYDEWIALPAGLVELPATSNPYWWLYAFDEIPWYLDY